MLKKLMGGTVLAAGALFGLGAQAAEAQEFRLHGFGGIAMLEDSDIAGYGYDAEISFDNGFVIGASAGVDMGSFVLEGEYAHRSADLDELSILGVTLAIPDSEISIDSLMANAWWQLPLSDRFEAYLGGGVGLGEGEVDVVGTTFESDTEFVWQLGAGVGMALEGGFSLGVGYRYFQVPEIEDADIDLASHDVLLEAAKTF